MSKPNPYLALTGISAELATELLERAVNQRGADFVYSKDGSSGPEGGCYYFMEGEPSCIIGTILSYLGIKPSQVQEGSNAESQVRSLFPDTSDVVLEALNEAQTKQDRGDTWGEALDAFSAVVGDPIVV
jgi:hypothetical protein